MFPELALESRHLHLIADGTTNQVSQFTGTEVWTVPGRANRLSS